MDDKTHESNYIKHGNRDILFVVPDLLYGDVALTSLNMVRVLVKNGDRVVVVSIEDGPFKNKFLHVGATVIVDSSLTPFLNNNLTAFRYFAEAFNFAVINTFSLSRVISELNGSSLPVLWWTHNDSMSQERLRHVLPEKLGSNIKPYTVSNYSKIAMKRLGLPYDFEILSCGVPLQALPKYKKNSTKSVVTFLVVGLIDKQNGQDMLLESIDLLEKRYLPISRFIFIGDIHDNNIMKMITRAANKYDNIVYIGDMERENVLKWYRQADYLIVPSREDPLSYAAIEAMMSNLPVICSDNTGVAEYITPYVNGLIFSSEGHEELSRLISFAVDNREEMDKMGRRAKIDIYEKYYAIDVFENNIYTIIDSMTADINKLSLSQNDSLSAQVDIYTEYIKLQTENNKLKNSLSWKTTKPFRIVAGFLMKITPLRLAYKVLKRLCTHGFTSTHLFIKRYISEKRKGKHKYIKNFTTKDLLSNWETELQSNTLFDTDIKISILTPIYNSNSKHLKEMIDSVTAQTYHNWELCLSDRINKTNSDVQTICERYTAADKRIKYKKLERNEGVSENTNHCLDMATGEYVALLNQNDLLHPSALYEVVGTICDKSADFIYTDESVFYDNPSRILFSQFKPDFAPDNLRSTNYINHLIVFETTLLERIGGFRGEFDGSQDYDLVLRLSEHAKNIVHIPKVLYYSRSQVNANEHINGEASSSNVTTAQKAIENHLARVGLDGAVESINNTFYRVRYEIKESLISIIIPNKDHTDDLDKCLKSIFTRTTYRNYEIIVVENNSVEKETFSFYESLKRYTNIKVIYWDGVGFNYSSINNFGVQYANGEYVLLLNNDVEVITPDWLQEMLMFAQRPDVGAVGAKLYFPDDTIQSAGIIFGIGEVAGSAHRGFPRNHHGYKGRLIYAQNLSCVTGACMMTRKEVYTEIGGLDERFKVAYNDCDFCLRIRKAGYLIVFTPFAELYHYESKTRGYEDTPEKYRRFEKEQLLFKSIWGDVIDRIDPYYNPNLTLDSDDFSLRR